MNDKRVLLFTSNLYNRIAGWSQTKDYHDGLNNIRKDMGLVGKSEEYVAKILCEWIEDEMRGLMRQFEKIQDVLITGTLDLWNGRHVIVPTRVDNLSEAFFYCADGVNYVEIYDNNGVIEINAYHHDGCNRLSVYGLNSKGVNSGDKANLEKKTYHRKIRLH